jgi:hypothetical protein
LAVAKRYAQLRCFASKKLQTVENNRGKFSVAITAGYLFSTQLRAVIASADCNASLLIATDCWR